ncbi:MAG: HPF/RaiA family ribosome-associated protein [Hyphomicrobiaceae bacterium]
MSLPLEITFHNMDRSDAVEARVREKIDHLAKLTDRMMNCRVTIEAPHKHHQKGNAYQVRILLDTPQGQVVVSRDPGDVHAHRDVYVAIRDAFDAAERQLKDRR